MIAEESTWRPHALVVVSIRKLEQAITRVVTIGLVPRRSWRFYSDARSIGETPRPRLFARLDFQCRGYQVPEVNAGSGHEVKAVMVAGRFLVRDYKVLTADEPAIRAEAQKQATAVAQRVAADPVHQEMALMEAMINGQL